MARCMLETCGMELTGGDVQVDFEKAFDKVRHDVLFKIFDYVGRKTTNLDGVKMSHHECITKFIVNKQITAPVDVLESVLQGYALFAPLCSFLRYLCTKII